MRGGEVVSRQGHILQNPGSSPGLATEKVNGPKNGFDVCSET